MKISQGCGFLEFRSLRWKAINAGVGAEYYRLFITEKPEPGFWSFRAAADKLLEPEQKLLRRDRLSNSDISLFFFIVLSALAKDEGNSLKLQRSIVICGQEERALCSGITAQLPVEPGVPIFSARIHLCITVCKQFILSQDGVSQYSIHS